MFVPKWFVVLPLLVARYCLIAQQTTRSRAVWSGGCIGGQTKRPTDSQCTERLRLRLRVVVVVVSHGLDRDQVRHVDEGNQPPQRLLTLPPSPPRPRRRPRIRPRPRPRLALASPSSGQSIPVADGGDYMRPRTRTSRTNQPAERPLRSGRALAERQQCGPAALGWDMSARGFRLLLRRLMRASVGP